MPFPPGGSSDVITRLVAQKLGENLKASIVIDNRGGGGGVPAALAMKQAAPDGYTLFLSNNGLFAIMPALTPTSASTRSRIPADHSAVRIPERAGGAVRVARAQREGFGGTRPVQAGWADLRVAGRGLGRPRPRRDAANAAGAPFVHVPYRGAGPAVTDLSAGNVDLLFSSYASAIGQVQGGKLSVIGWTAPKRSPTLPDVPTMTDAGYPGRRA